MKASLRLEIINESAIAGEAKLRKICDQVSPGITHVLVGSGGNQNRLNPKPWVAEITGTSRRFGLKREFLRYRKDYVDANSKGSRGVRACYVLESGKFYEVFSRISWSRTHRYFCVVTSKGDIVEIEREEIPYA